MLVVSSNSGREFLELELEGVRRYFHTVFSAPSDFNQTKKATDFYLKVCSDLGIDQSEMAHVGDHWVFDFVVPRSVGINAFYLNRKGERQDEFIVKDLRQFSDEVNSLS
jgi:putative hydrolase of the HAD superfamily